MDRHRSSIPENQTAGRSGSRSRLRSPKGGNAGQRPGEAVDITAMVRSLQRTAGMTDCFRMGNLDCDSTDCDWRTYCLESPEGEPPSPRGTRTK